jgi:hypothetical protein
VLAVAWRDSFEFLDLVAAGSVVRVVLEGGENGGVVFRQLGVMF